MKTFFFSSAINIIPLVSIIVLYLTYHLEWKYLLLLLIILCLYRLGLFLHYLLIYHYRQIKDLFPFHLISSFPEQMLTLYLMWYLCINPLLLLIDNHLHILIWILHYLYLYSLWHWHLLGFQLLSLSLLWISSLDTIS